jgi:hypothetical protein
MRTPDAAPLMTHEPDKNLRITRETRQWAVLRFLLGNAQMFMAVVAIVLLLKSGVNVWSITAVLVASILTVTSRLLFRKRT